MVLVVPPDVVEVAGGVRNNGWVGVGHANELRDLRPRPGVAAVRGNGKPREAAVILRQEDAAVRVGFHMTVQAAAETAGRRIFAQERGGRCLRESAAAVEAAGTPRVGDLIDAVVADLLEVWIERGQWRVSNRRLTGDERLVVIGPAHCECARRPVRTLVV